MIDIMLRHVTGDNRSDALLHTLIGQIEATLPGRIRSYYLFGSYVSGDAVALSDLDLFLVTRSELSPEAKRTILQIADALGDTAHLAVEVLLVADHQVLRTGHYRIEAASVLLYGEDVRPALPPVSLAEYIRTYVAAPAAYAGRILRHTQTLTYPLTYPDAHGEFYGYDVPHFPHSNAAIPNTTALVALVCWIATLCVAWDADVMVPSRSASVRLYRQYVGNQWTAFVAEVHAQCKMRWAYQIPGDVRDRLELRRLCAQTLAFENSYLLRYRDYLQTVLNSGSESERRWAAQELRTMGFSGKEP